jgi:CDP-diacylglycerol---serine O-phosphatidyltransferase
MKLRDLMFVLPNLFTVSSIFCGFYAMTLCVGSSDSRQLYLAALSIFFGVFFDGFDGRVARLTKTQSMFGQELDSLADVVTFGAAPALLMWRWALAPMGFGGVFAAFVFAACGALRLARFNVLAIRSPHGGASQFFVGMPIPFAALGLISMVIGWHHTSGGELPAAYRPAVLGVLLFLAALMVSTVRYRTFKDMKPSPGMALLLGSLIAIGVAVALLSHPAAILAVFFGLYLISGLIESVILVRRYFVAAKAGSAGSVADAIDSEVTDDEDDVDEQEVL